MSLTLNRKGTDPQVTVSSRGLVMGEGKDHTVCLVGDGFEIDISMTDFLLMAHYVITNTDLENDDPRLQFVACMRLAQVVGGHNHDRNPNSKRLETYVTPVFTKKEEGEPS